MDDRRRFERVSIPASAGVYLNNNVGSRIGAVLMLGRGGLLVEGAGGYAEGEKHTVIIVDESEEISRAVDAVVRYVMPEAVGFEYDNLGADAAVEIGVIIGKYYSAGQAAGD